MSHIGKNDGLIISLGWAWINSFWEGSTATPTRTCAGKWTGETRNGYGTVELPGEGRHRVNVHRAMWIALRGPIHEGLQIDHDQPGIGCHNRLCANPSHLLPVPSAENCATAPNGMANRTHCPAGHPLLPPNLVPSSFERGARVCLTCNRARSETVQAAARHLGLTHAKYIDQYDSSSRTAKRVLAS